MKKILEKILANYSKKILLKYNPKIVGVTGSIGKTSAKEAVYSVLSEKYRVRRSLKNYNNEIGVPITIIGCDGGGRSLTKWFKVISKARSLIKNNHEYPEVLVLEMGADRFGDIEYLTNLAPCDVGVITKISPAHIEYFKSIEKVAKEKSVIVTHLKKENTAVLNFDDENCQKIAKKVKANIIWFGKTKNSQVSYSDISNSQVDKKITGLQFKIDYNGSTVPMFIPDVIGAHQINAALIAVSVGISFGMNLIEISQGLKHYESPKGRMHLIDGTKNSLIIDDTYNSSPDAANAAVSSVGEIATSSIRKIAVLGDMLELGDMTDSSHFELGKNVAKSDFDLLIAVGKNADKTIEGAKKSGLKNIQKFETSTDAGEYLKKEIKENDIILIKGSQGSRMEKTVKIIMKNPKDAEKLLVRQDQAWQ